MVNEELKALRHELGMTTKELSAAIDVNHRTYQGWESGRLVSKVAIRAIGALMWMGKADRESWLKYIETQANENIR